MSMLNHWLLLKRAVFVSPGGSAQPKSRCSSEESFCVLSGGRWEASMTWQEPSSLLVPLSWSSVSVASMRMQPIYLHFAGRPVVFFPWSWYSMLMLCTPSAYSTNQTFSTGMNREHHCHIHVYVFNKINSSIIFLCRSADNGYSWVATFLLSIRSGTR
jgi:hypothetical protein